MPTKPLAPAIRSWIQKALDLGCDAPLSVSLRHLLACPGAFTTSPDHAYYAGLLVGRLVELDRRGRADVDGDCLERVYELIEPYTLFPPATAVYALAGLDPYCLLSLIATWPERYERHRPFYLSVMLGILAENPKVEESVGTPAREVLFDMLESSRRKDAGQDRASDGDALSLI